MGKPFAVADDSECVEFAMTEGVAAPLGTELLIMFAYFTMPTAPVEGRGCSRHCWWQGLHEALQCLHSEH